MGFASWPRVTQRGPGRGQDRHRQQRTSCRKVLSHTAGHDRVFLSVIAPHVLENDGTEMQKYIMRKKSVGPLRHECDRDGKARGRPIFLLPVVPLTALVAGSGCQFPNETVHIAIHPAAAEGRIGALESLKTKGADVNAKDDNGKTPHSVANHMATASWLIAGGAQ